MTTRFLTPTRLAVAGAVLMATSQMAAAQSAVTIYGRIDLGVQYSNKTARADDRLVELSNGGIRPSILGFKGSEDLGGGMTAFFNLEHHLSADTGTATPTFWRRQANAGLKGSWGAVTLGRQYSPALLGLLSTEPRAFKENLSGLYPYAFNQIPAGNTVNDLGIFIGNAVSYSNAFGPFNLGAAIAAGEGTGRTSSIGLSYNGPLMVGLGYQKIDGREDDDGTTLMGIGAGMPLGAFTIKAQYMRFEEDRGGARIGETNSFGIGADYAWSQANTANITYYDIKNKKGTDDQTSTLVVSNDYAMSKRTILYVQAAFANGDDGATLRTTVIANGVNPGSNTSVFNVGISHNF